MAELSMSNYELIEPDEVEYAEYSANFASYNSERSGWAIQTFSFVMRDHGRIIAGVRGHVYLGALEIRGLWVDESLRGRGIGRDLLRAVEHEAQQRGASKAMLYTYSWQAEEFYRAHGYREFARFDFPAGHYRVDMERPL